MRKKWVLWIYIVIWMKKFDLDDKTFLKMGDCGVKQDSHKKRDNVCIN